MDYVELSNGVKMPQLGYGVYQVDPAEAERCVADALAVGNRLIDTAQAYYNEEGVGAAIAKSGIPRDEIFLVSKVWVSNASYEKAKASIGVSNFMADRLTDLCEFVEVTPQVNQVETHILQQQIKLREVMDKYGVQHMSRGPFAEGKNDFFDNPVLTEIGAQHGKTAAHMALRYLLQRGVVIIPKSTHRERMEQDFDLFDFKLDDAATTGIRLLRRSRTKTEDLKAVLTVKSGSGQKAVFPLLCKSSIIALTA